MYQMISLTYNKPPRIFQLSHCHGYLRFTSPPRIRRLIAPVFYCPFFESLSLFLFWLAVFVSFFDTQVFVLFFVSLNFYLSLFLSFLFNESVALSGVFQEPQPLDGSAHSHERCWEFPHWDVRWDCVAGSQTAATSFKRTVERPLPQSQTSNEQKTHTHTKYSMYVKKQKWPNDIRLIWRAGKFSSSSLICCSMPEQMSWRSGEKITWRLFLPSKSCWTQQRPNSMLLFRCLSSAWEAFCRMWRWGKQTASIAHTFIHLFSKDSVFLMIILHHLSPVGVSDLWTEDCNKLAT